MKGYVVYSVNDEQGDKHGTVTVSIVTTPKTLGQSVHVDSNAIAANSLGNGINEVLAELQSNLLPPVGGKVIVVPSTGELAFIGFGSAVVQHHDNPAIKAKLTIDAQKNSAMRARSALCGIIVGDEITAGGSLPDGTREMHKDFEQAQAEDPLNEAVDKSAVRKLSQQRDEFLNTHTTKEQITSMRKGVLPPGVNTKTFLNDQKTIATAVSIYLPSASATAADMAKRMNESTILKKHDPKSGISATQGGTNGVLTAPERGVSGQISNDANL